MEAPKPQKEHHWLQKLVGNWTMDSVCSMGPDQPSAEFKGTQKTESLGGLWTVGHMEGEMPGGGMGKSIITLGYDPELGKFVGTFIGGMMTSFWHYVGSLDKDERVLTLDTEGPNFTSGGKAQYQDIIEIVDDNHHILRSHMQNDDGSWSPDFMTAHFHRVN